MAPPFDDVREASAAHSNDFKNLGVRGVAGRSLLILTCMDSRIVPHRVLDMEVGDVKVIRNAGGQLNQEVEKDIVLASHLLEVDRILIMPHTRCAMASINIGDVRDIVSAQSGVDASEFSPRLIEDAHAKLAADVETLRSNPLLRPGTEIAGAFYDVDTGEVDFS
mgnify:CR=1 FL=1